ncbi:WD40 repeat domain-containing protein [Antarctobacter sp.]|uniref:WD40 repeat domain-containing protein n=1 Tax=Antarctobacter sp. TaxID=1872577 RepID=UPI002B26F146|nr:WD40 repeat domain-containing protein [Antarctobacter sp.]
MRSIFSFAAALALAGFSAGAAHAQTIETISVSPDGKTVLVGGSNRTVYTISAETMEVTGRRYVPQLVRQIVHGAIGEMVFFRDDADVLTAYKVDGMTEAWQVSDVDDMVYDAPSRVIAALDKHFKDDSVRLLQASTGEQLARVAMGKIKADLIALEPGAGKALILTGYTKTDAEQKQDEPTDLTKLQKADFKQKTDGYVSNVVTVDFVAGSFEMAETGYRVSYPKAVRLDGDKMMVLRTNMDSMLLGPDGTGELIDLGEDYFNHAGIDAKGESYILSKGVELRFVPVNGEGAEGLLKGDRLRGGPAEWITAMTEASDGTLYFGTNAYRLLKVGPTRGKIEIMPIY